MNKEVKPTWNYILNDLALYSLLIKCLYSEDVPKQDKVDLEHQIKLLQQKEDQLQQKVNQLESKLNEVKEWKEEFGDACTFSIVSNPSLGSWYYSLEDILEEGGSNE